ncbi:NADP-dependent oxidoreductase [Microbacterium terregens]|uniref:NADP-dependent oxidoreductase n=1 Tax=Microbacterium terregens TaxID=69363 RepID=A0ABV5T0I1_9MICO
MRAIGFEEFGGPEVLHEIDYPDPEPRSDEVRIRVEAATVNSGDTYMRKGQVGSLGHRPPWVPGMEAAGVVERVGPVAAQRFAVGDPVTAFVIPTDPRGGAYGELAVTSASRVIEVPRGATVAEAATLPMNGITAQLLLDAMDLRPRSIVAVIGAAGAVGGYVVQLAHTSGHTVIADAGESDQELLAGLGADFLVPRGAGVLDAIRLVADGDVDGVALAAAPWLNAASIVHSGGVVATAVGIAESAQLSSARRRGVRIVPVRVDLEPDPAAILERLRDLTQAGALRLRVAAELPARDASEAHRRLEAGGLRGRQVLRF